VKLSNACPFSPYVARFHVFAHRLAFLGVFAITRGNIRVRAKLSNAFPFSPDVARFHVSAHPLAFSGVSAITQGNVCVRVKLSDACPFSADVARFYVFAHRLAIFRRFRCMWGPRFTTRNSRYAYNSRSHDQYVVSPHNRADIKVTSSITIPNIKSYNWSHDQD
jgi:hypothetical protein